MNETKECAAPSDCPDVNCEICGEPIDEFGDALDTLYEYAMLDEQIEEFARQHPGKKLEFETLVRCSVVNDDSFGSDEIIVYAGPILDSDNLYD